MMVWHARGSRPSALVSGVLGLVVVGLVGCAAGPLGTPTASSAAKPGPTASQSAGLVGTTEDADVAPAGAVRVELYALKFHPGDIPVAAGTAVFFLVNPKGKSFGPHAMAIGHRVGVLLASSTAILVGKSAVFTVSGLTAGRYVIWCPIDGHAAEGMVGSLTVH